MLDCFLFFVMLISAEASTLHRSGTPQNFIEETIDSDSLSFLIVGDNGGLPEPFYSTRIQRYVADKMAIHAKNHNCKFILLLGDNFYFLGVKDVYDRRWRGTFEDVYSDPALYIPWYPTTGNHDWHGSVQAQLDYSKVSTRWTFPWYWYTLQHTLQPSGVKIRTIMFETTIPCGIGLHPDGVPLDQSMADEQWAWLEKELQDGQDADYLLVTGHYPIYSAGVAGPTTECIRQKMEPLMKTYRVTAYIAGHDHNAQYLISNDQALPTHHIIVGCGSDLTARFPNVNYKDFTTKFKFAAWNDFLTSNGCFARVDVGQAHMTVTFIQGKDGAEIYTVTLPRRDRTIL